MENGVHSFQHFRGQTPMLFFLWFRLCLYLRFEAWTWFWLWVINYLYTILMMNVTKTVVLDMKTSVNMHVIMIVTCGKIMMMIMIVIFHGTFMMVVLSMKSMMISTWWWWQWWWPLIFWLSSTFKPRSTIPTKEILATWNPKASIIMEYRKETAGQVAVEQMSMVTVHCTSRGGKEKQRNNEGTKTKIGEE